MEQTPGPEIAPYEQCPTTTEPLDGERGAAGIAPARPRDAYELEEEEPSEQIGGGVAPPETSAETTLISGEPGAPSTASPDEAPAEMEQIGGGEAHASSTALQVRIRIPPPETPAESPNATSTRCAIRFASSNRMKRFDARGSRAKPDCLGLQHLWPRYQSRASSRAPSPRREEP